MSRYYFCVKREISGVFSSWNIIACSILSVSGDTRKSGQAKEKRRVIICKTNIKILVCDFLDVSVITWKILNVSKRYMTVVKILQHPLPFPLLPSWVLHQFRWWTETFRVMALSISPLSACKVLVWYRYSNLEKRWQVSLLNCMWKSASWFTSSCVLTMSVLKPQKNFPSGLNLGK